MSFASLDRTAVDDLIERSAAAGQLTLIVGAGASMEAQLPSWRGLVERLLWRVAKEQPGLPTSEARKEWVERTLRQDDLLAARAVAQVVES